jgi:hypothetical protein
MAAMLPDVQIQADSAAVAAAQMSDDDELQVCLLFVFVCRAKYIDIFFFFFAMLGLCNARSNV